MNYVAVIAAVIDMALLSVGSAVADTAALAVILLPMMKSAGYNPPALGGLIAAGGVIAPVIPPFIGKRPPASPARSPSPSLPRRHRPGS